MEIFTTPMMQQYVTIKKQYNDCLLFFRVGDFYELFLDDAFIGSKVLDITLTSRSKGKDGRIPLAGVPYHAVDSYISKLVKAGYKVAICEQVTEPNKYGIVDREVVRVITPGTVLDEKILDRKENNYIISLCFNKKVLALAAADISTGHIQTSEIEYDNLEQSLRDELLKLQPVECILSDSLYNNPHLLKILKSSQHLNIFLFPEWESYSNNAEQFLKAQFKVTSLMSFGLEDKLMAQQVSAALLGYLKYTQKDKITHFKTLTAFKDDMYMNLDRSTIMNLELFSTLRDLNRKGSLIQLIDRTHTAMGGRTLRSWIRKPLLSIKEITKRYDLIDLLLSEPEKRKVISEKLTKVSDIERILSKLSVGIGNARDLIALKESLKTIYSLKKDIKNKDKLLSQIDKGIHEDTAHIVDLIEQYIKEEPRFELKEGGLIKEGIDTVLDKLRTNVKVSKDWVVSLEKQERERTGISSLKVRFNQVFGFYIEVSKSHVNAVPKNYLRKQTLVNGERFITPELKEKEEIILTAEEKINKLEYEIYLSVLNKVLDTIKIIQEAARSIAVLDCILNFAEIAETEQYSRPVFNDIGEIVILEGRHPVVEKMLQDSQFVPNNVTLSNNDHQLLILTGPNMAGKSVFVRQVALIVLLAQVGSFVPAKSARLSIVDRIFVRSGAADIISEGLSTFMVEMVETAQILNHATNKSLIVMDEIGRGTSTYDGISLAWAIAEYLVTHSTIQPKTLFATHYHELQMLELQHPGRIKNYHMAVEEYEGEPIFLHTIIPEGASHSYGVAVAKLAGLPQPVIDRALVLLQELEQRSLKGVQTKATLSKRSTKNDEVIQQLKELNVDMMTPLEALNHLAELKKKVKS